jgi:hypothetical protein
MWSVGVKIQQALASWRPGEDMVCEEDQGLYNHVLSLHLPPHFLYADSPDASIDFLVEERKRHANSFHQVIHRLHMG